MCWKTRPADGQAGRRFGSMWPRTQRCLGCAKGATMILLNFFSARTLLGFRGPLTWTSPSGLRWPRRSQDCLAVRKAKHVCDFVRLPFRRTPGHCNSPAAREVLAFAGGRATKIFWHQALTASCLQDYWCSPAGVSRLCPMGAGHAVHGVGLRISIGRSAPKTFEATAILDGVN